MRETSKKILALLLAAAMALSLAACGRSSLEQEIPESTGGQDVVRAEAADKVFTLNSAEKYSINPLVATNHANQLICDLVYENII